MPPGTRIGYGIEAPSPYSAITQYPLPMPRTVLFFTMRDHRRRDHGRIFITNGDPLFFTGKPAGRPLTPGGNFPPGGGMADNGQECGVK